MNVRHPIAAGAFYEASPDSCRRHAASLLAAAEVPADLPGRPLGAIVPHAGWVYSGAIAAKALKAALAGGEARSVVLFGADHTGMVQMGEVYDAGAWRTPLGDVGIDEELAAALLAAGDCLRAQPHAHMREHSLEVQVPLLQVLVGDLRIVPVAVPPSDLAVEIGRTVGQALAARGQATCVVGSTDLTHHGGRFGSPGGRGEAGEKWTRANDRRMIDLIEAMDADAVVPEYLQRHNACGAGAVAATIAACKALGAQRGICLEYNNSYKIVHEKYPYELDDTTVGYAAVVFA